MMKRFTGMLLAGMMVALIGCGNAAAPAATQAAAETEAVAETEALTVTAVQGGTTAGDAAESAAAGGSLVVYFSWSGNTRTVAEEIQTQTGAEIFEIQPETPYSEDYNTVLDEAKEEQSVSARPAIAGAIDGFENYDTIFLGYPNWWGDMPMIIYSFLDAYDLSGKTIVPFCTSGGSGFSDSLGTIQKMEPEAAMLEGLSLGSSQAKSPKAAVAEWLAENGIS